MNPASWEQAKDVITKALKRAPMEREQFVRERCANSALAGEIITLLAAYGDGADFLADPAEDEHEELEPGTRVGPYIIIDSIGRGGMGHVFLGNDPRLRRKVALKCVIRSIAGSGERRLRILHEARAAASVVHPNVATIHDVVEHENRAFIVMEYVEGESLAARLKRERLPIDRVIAIGRQLASALSAAHAKRVVHRDLKPGNVHFTADGTVKVLDFGIANTPRMTTTVASNVPTMGALIPTNRGAQPGTPPYMSPEQLLGRGVDERSDIYSLGVVLFEMAAGRRPHRETDAAELLVAIVNGTPRADAVDPRVPTALARVIEKALALDIKARYQSAAEVGAALEGVEAELKEKQKGLGELIRRWMARVAIGTLMISIVLAGVGLITTTGFNLTFGRTNGPFGSEPISMYVVWGARALFPSIVIMTITAVVTRCARFVIGVLELIEPVGRIFGRIRARARAIAVNIGLDTPAGLGQASTVLAVVALIAMCWYHAGLIGAWTGFVDSAPAEQLFPLHPDNVERLWYRVQLDILILGFGVLLYRVIQLQKQQKTHGGTAAVAMLAAVIAVMVLMNEYPYRMLSHRDFERVDAAGTTCYITGESTDEWLLFCPRSDRPRNRTVKRADPNVRRSGTFENVFEKMFDAGKPSRSGS